MSDGAPFVTIDQIIDQAREVTELGAYIWAASGAGQGVTSTRNRQVLDRLALVPQMLPGTAATDPSTTFMGVPMSLPVLLAPVGALGIYNEGDGLAAARAATAVGTSAMTSCLTLSPWEDVAATAPGHHFFQLYVFGDRTWCGDVAARVHEAGFAAIAVTIDTPAIGRRDRSLEHDYVWTYPQGGPPNLVEHGWDTSHRTNYTWADLAWLCETSPLPIIAKGIMTASDAKKALDCGVQGIYVSNHGGRQLDHAVSTIEMLSEITEAVGSDADIAIDGGFTRGPDVCKALAFGATVAGIGRLQCWGLAADGESGLITTLDILRQEITNTIANIGCTNPTDITKHHVRWSIPIHEPSPEEREPR